MKGLEGKVAIITGCAQGLGVSLMRAYHEAGAKVIAIDIQGEKLRNEVAKLGTDDVIAVEGDIANEQLWTDVCALAIEKWGHLEILVNNAALQNMKDITVEAPDEFRRAIDVNLTAPYLAIREFQKVATKCSEKSLSSIINISSTGGIMGGLCTSGCASYNASKGGLRLLTKHAAYALAKDGIRVNSVHPGAMATQMMYDYRAAHPESVDKAKVNQPLAPHATPPENVADMCVFLSSDSCNTMTGSEVVVDCGFTAGKN